MTRPVHTVWLLVLVLFLGLVDVGARWAPDADREALPGIAAFDAGLVDRIELGSTDDTIVLAREGDAWAVVAPVEAPADAAVVQQLVGRLARGVRPEARLDDGRYDAYGLAGGEELRVRLLAGEAELVSLLVGRNASDGATFVRLGSDPAVYRALVGGRSLVDRPAAAWVDRSVLGLPDGLDPSAVRIEASGVWSAEGLSAAQLDALARDLVGWRALSPILDDDRVTWGDAAVTVVGEGIDVTLELGAAGSRRAVRREGRAWWLAADDPVLARIEAALAPRSP